MVWQWLALVSVSFLLAVHLRTSSARNAAVMAVLSAALLTFAANRDNAPVAKLAAASIGMLYLMKTVMLLSYPRAEARSMGTAAYFMWPGMDPERPQRRGAKSERDAYPIVSGLAFFFTGVALLLCAALLPLPAAASSWIAIFGFLAMIHFGIANIWSSAYRLSGRAVTPLFDRPYAARTLNDFWSRRWNLAFVEMDRRLVLPGLIQRFGMRWAVFGAFLVSGALHEMAISYPAGGGWGMPLTYFAIQGLLVLIERRIGLRSRLFTWMAVLLPIPLLFTSPFRAAIISPLLRAVRSMLLSHPLSWYFDWGLWVMAIANFLVLVASFQVPSKLNWKIELARLSPFNRKLMYAYGAFILLTIVTFGVFTLALRSELLSGSRPAMFIAGFIAVFWALRIGLDAFYYKHEDWPSGVKFVIGHALLTSLFLFLSLSYGSLVIWHLVSN